MICPDCGYAMSESDAVCPHCRTAARPGPATAPTDIDAILVDALGRIGTAAGGVGGGSGARFTARRLSRGVHNATFEHSATVAQTVAALTHLLQATGEILETQQEASHSTMTAVVSSGFMNMNPCVLVFSVAPASATASTVEVTGYAKEGIINQHTAKKAIEAVLQQLSSA